MGILALTHDVKRMDMIHAMPSMPRLLYRMMLVDLLRVIGLAAGVLVTVVAFGATIKPLANDSLLNAAQTFKYLSLAIVPMLQFALPFAAGFGATIAMHRMTADNELQAMAVSGLSYRRILMPVVALGAGLLVFMAVLTQEVIPRFWSLLEQMIAEDFTRIFQASIRRGEPFKIGDMRIYADEMIVEYAPEGRDGPESRMKLLKVAAAELDRNGRVVTDVTANRAVVDVYRSDGATLIKLALYDTVAYNAETGDLQRIEAIIPSRAIIMPSVRRDNPKANSRGELLRLRDNPDDFAQVQKLRQDLADALRELEDRQSLDAQLRESGRVELLAPQSPDARPGAPLRRYIVTADRLVDQQFVLRGGGPVTIVQAEGERGLRRFVAESATLVPTSVSEAGMPLYDLVLGRHEVYDLQTGGGVNMRERQSFPRLSIQGVSGEDLLALSSDELIRRARAVRGEQVKGRANLLEQRIQRLQWEISGRLLNRYALSVTAPLLLMLGAVLAMWLRGSLPLTIYMLAFLPSVLDLVAISAGEQLMRDGRLVVGAAVMWSGNVLMLGVIILAYLRVARH